MSDYIQSLPEDEIPIKVEDRELLETILRKDNSKLEKFIHELKLPILAGILFLIMSMPQVTNFLRENVAYARTDISLLCLKTVMFMFIFFLYLNMSYLMK
jgi:hypothetical protein